LTHKFARYIGGNNSAGFVGILDFQLGHVSNFPRYESRNNVGEEKAAKDLNEKV
jgi:hypothetical protein